ncbi:MAG: amino acid deaminase [Rhodoferax sp.]|nr:amino acid deaminase [Rhodoferax sp.]
MQLDHDFKGFPTGHAPLDLGAVGAQGWQVLGGDLPLPLAVLKQSALAHNLAWMSNFCAQRGLDIAPHGKTTMSPELYARQIAAGAWGISFATVYQAAVGARHGVERIIIANQVLQMADLDGLAHLLRSYPRLQACFLVDSLAQVEAIDAWHHEKGPGVVFSVLLEQGLAGKRTGCRTREQALALARRVKASPALRLAGIECYEGSLASCRHEEDRAGVAALMARLQETASDCEREDLFECDEVLLTAGGSAIFDLVADHLGSPLNRPTRRVLRSGCYLTHDHLQYRRHLQCVGERLRMTETLRPALEVWSVVQSCPEPGLALLSMGKRDVSYDLEMPAPVWRAHAGQGRAEAVPGHWSIAALNDQHAYLKYDPGSPLAQQPQVGQRVGCGISHPCTTFDKWRWMPVVDDDYRVVDAVSIHF